MGAALLVRLYEKPEAHDVPYHIVPGPDDIAELFDRSELIEERLFGVLVNDVVQQLGAHTIIPIVDLTGLEIDSHA